MNISPLLPIPVSYVVLPTDSTLYYVQSVLRDTTSGRILQTINLTQDPVYVYRYAGQFSSVSDASGMGRPIDITTIVYTDSGHTTPSQNYAALLVPYVVLQQWIPTLGAGGGGSIDYEKLRKTIAELIEEKIYGSTEKVKEGFSLIPRTKIKYSRISEDMRVLIDALKEEVLAENRGSTKSVIDLLGKVISGLGDRGEAHKELDGKVAKVIASLDSLSTDHRVSGSSRHTEVLKALKESHADMEPTLTAHSKILDGRLGARLDEIRDHITKNFSDKEVRLNFNMMPGEENKKAKDSKMSMDHVLSLLD